MGFIKPPKTVPMILKDFAESHGYTRFQCSVHGGYWSNAGNVCPYCPDDGRIGNAYQDSKNAGKILSNV